MNQGERRLEAGAKIKAFGCERLLRTVEEKVYISFLPISMGNSPWGIRVMGRGLIGIGAE